MIGNHNGPRKLTASDAKAIRELHAWKLLEVERLNAIAGIDALAEKFDVHPRTVEKILKYETWRHVP